MLRVVQLACLKSVGRGISESLNEDDFSEGVLGRKGQLGFGRY